MEKSEVTNFRKTNYGAKWEEKRNQKSVGMIKALQMEGVKA